MRDEAEALLFLALDHFGQIIAGDHVILHAPHGIEAFTLASMRANLPLAFPQLAANVEQVFRSALPLIAAAVPSMPAERVYFLASGAAGLLVDRSDGFTYARQLYGGLLKAELTAAFARQAIAELGDPIARHVAICRAEAVPLSPHATIQ
jgi:hypothetical protein